MDILLMEKDRDKRANVFLFSLLSSNSKIYIMFSRHVQVYLDTVCTREALCETCSLIQFLITFLLVIHTVLLLLSRNNREALLWLF